MSLPWSEERTPDDSSSFPDPCQHSLKVSSSIPKNVQSVPWDCTQGQRVRKPHKKLSHRFILSHSFLLQDPSFPKDHELVFRALQHIRLAEAGSNSEGFCICGGFLLCYMSSLSQSCHRIQNWGKRSDTSSFATICCACHPVVWGWFSKGCGPSWPTAPCWVVFGAQRSVGEGILFALGLMAVNTYLAICWPLISLSFVDSVKYRIPAGTWIIIIVKNACLLLIEGTSSTQGAVLKSEPLRPVVLNGIPARATGMVFLFFLLSIILRYSLIYKEGKLAGHFNRSNIKARKTVLIHLVQFGLHVISTLLFVGLGKMCGVFFFALNLVLFGVFAFAQCFNPLIYGLWNRELQSRLYHWMCCRLWCGHTVTSRGPV